MKRICTTVTAPYRSPIVERQSKNCFEQNAWRYFDVSFQPFFQPSLCYPFNNHAIQFLFLNKTPESPFHKFYLCRFGNCFKARVSNFQGCKYFQKLVAVQGENSLRWMVTKDLCFKILKQSNAEILFNRSMECLAFGVSSKSAEE
jgi:hypothetical protein